MAGFLPTTDAGLVTFSQNASTLVSATPAAFGVPITFAASYATATSDYADAYSASNEEATRSKITIAAKNTARRILRDASKQLSALVRAFPAITDAQLTSLGLTVRDHENTPVPPPGLAPVVTVKSVFGRTVRGNLRDATTESSRRRPVNAKGALVLYAWGPTPPPASGNWKVAGQSTRTKYVVQFPEEVQPGTPCYIVSMWYNERGEYSPASEPLTVYLAIGPASEDVA